MAAVGLHPFDDLESLLALQRSLDRFFQNPRGVDLGPSGPGVFPPINIFTNADGLVIRTEVPGVSADALQISVERDTVTISGERVPERKTGGAYHRRERRFGKFSRSVKIPADLAGDKAVAECRNGILTIRIPKREEAKPRQIKVQNS